MGERIVLVEYQGGVPFSVVTFDGGSYRHYDVAWSKRFGCFLNNESSNSLHLEHADNEFWTPLDAIEAQLRASKDRPATGRRLKEPVAKHPLESILDGIESQLIYCNECDDFMPSPDGDWACDHVFWCDDHGCWAGGVGEDGCGCERKGE